MRDILAVAMSVEADEPALRAAQALVEAFDANAAAIAVSIHPGSQFAAADLPLSEILADLAKGAGADAALKKQDIIEWAAKVPRPMQVRAIEVEDALLGKEIIAETLCADLVTLTRGPGPARRKLLEIILFGAGRPLLLLPEHWRREHWDTIVVAWNARREARRAVGDAMPLLQRAKRVCVATVDAEPSPAGHAEAPGVELAHYLARRGVAAEVHNLDGLGRTQARALNDFATYVDADLIVMGAYGHARAREFLFGGVTREMLSAAPAPLLLAH
ncbi:MAG: universal stress protein [Hyphomonadaceae bacterium]|nr:universal stress protein [Hyphomonadaceae bacterium]